MSSILSFLDIFKKIQPILQEIIQRGGKPYLVGGAVRDLVLDRQIKDVDIEVHGIVLEDLQSCLKNFGRVKLVGKKFGVLRLYGFDIDWSLPRKDTKGRRPTVEIDPNMTIEQACKRRDLTMNAMAIELNKVSLMSFERLLNIVDPYNGLEHIKQKKLHAVDEKLFLDDPLRFFRVLQFIGRFEFYPDEKLEKLCKKMKLCDTYTGSPLARERIFDEIKKLFLKSRRPSLGLRWLKDIGRLKEIFPELYDLVGVMQRKDYHPEGDVFEHTMQTLDAAATFKDYENESEKFLIMLAGLCHDLGKPECIDANLSTNGHEKSGVPIAKKLLKRLTNDKILSSSVCKLVLCHMRPFILLKEKAGLKAYKRLALKLAPQVSMRQAAILNLCDIRGRNAKSSEPLEIYKGEFDLFLQKAKNANVEHHAQPAVLQGRHLLDIIKPGPQLGRLLKQAYEIQIEEDIKDVDELKKRVLKKWH